MKAAIAFEFEQLVNRRLSLLEMNGHCYHNKSEHIQTDGSYFSNLFVSYYFRFTLYSLSKGNVCTTFAKNLVSSIPSEESYFPYCSYIRSPFK